MPKNSRSSELIQSVKLKFNINHTLILKLWKTYIYNDLNLKLLPKIDSIFWYIMK